MACVDKVNFMWKHKYCEEKQRSVTSKEVGVKKIWHNYMRVGLCLMIRMNKKLNKPLILKKCAESDYIGNC